VTILNIAIVCIILAFALLFMGALYAIKHKGHGSGRDR